MKKFTIKEDDWSFQIVAGDSTIFFIRVTTSKTNKTLMVFSDFILDTDDDMRAVEALHLIKGQFYGPAPGMKLVFQDIFPSFNDSKDHTELISRHDQIVTVVKAFALQAGLTVENTFLNLQAGKFHTGVLIE